MQKALNYLRSFWDQLFLYIKDGRYCIDRSALPLGSSKNSLAERTLRPMTVERKRSSSAGLLPTGRKNSLTFGSHDGAEVSVIYHTFIETCKMVAYPHRNILRNSSRQSCREEPIMRTCYR